MSVNDKIRALRELNNWSQEDMAERLNMSKSSYSRLERDERKLDLAKDLLRKYPEDLQFPNEIRKPNPKKRQGIQTAHRCNARPFS